MLEIICPANAHSERSYIIDWVLSDVFGLEYRLSFYSEHRGDIQIRRSGMNEKKLLKVADCFFESFEKHWLKSGSLPEMPIETFRGMAVLYGRQGDDSEGCEGEWCPVDLFGSLFFLLSRYEEAVLTERDNHDRFPGKASIVVRSGLVHRAIGNEYIEYLWSVLKGLWPDLKRKERTFRIRPSHDIDRPSAFWKETYQKRTKLALRSLAKNQNRQSTGVFLRESANFKRNFNADLTGDPNDTVDWIIKESESAGRQSTFYYIPVQTHERFDAGMPLDHPLVERQWRSIQDAGHQLGVHPGYETYLDEPVMRRSVEVFAKQREKIGLGGEPLLSRQHYLRWQACRTPRIMEDVGIAVDSTVGFSSQAGFRAGICYEYPMYDLNNRKPLALRQQPLIVMECSVLDARYMGLGRSEEAMNVMLGLKEECRKYQGDFTVLWHNQRFIDPKEREMYRTLIS